MGSQLAAVFPVLVVNMVSQSVNAEFRGVSGVYGVTGPLDPAVRQRLFTGQSGAKIEEHHHSYHAQLIRKWTTLAEEYFSWVPIF